MQTLGSKRQTNKYSIPILCVYYKNILVFHISWFYSEHQTNITAISCYQEVVSILVHSAILVSKTKITHVADANHMHQRRRAQKEAALLCIRSRRTATGTGLHCVTELDHNKTTRVRCCPVKMNSFPRIYLSAHFYSR